MGQITISVILVNINLKNINMKDTKPNIEPIKLKDYESKQSKYQMVAKLPMRSVLLGPSGSGKRYC